MNDAVKVARIQARQQDKQAVRDTLMQFAGLLNNPVILGFGGLIINHAIYKAGWYKPVKYVPAKSLLGFTGALGPFDKSGDEESDAQHMHDSIALFIMMTSAIYANRGLTDSASLLKAGISAIK